MWGVSEIRATGTLKNLDLSQELSILTIPTLFITGEFDTAKPESLARFAQNMPKSILEIVPNCGHAAPAEAPEKYLEIVKEFLKRKTL
jgi:proline iminopeptidase